jgi:tetratricopeptide (TPR) repeat protein
MNRTKICPACQKEIPILAVRCKFCGFRLSGRKDSDSSNHDSTNQMKTLDPPTPLKPHAASKPSQTLARDKSPVRNKTLMGMQSPLDLSHITAKSDKSKEVSPPSPPKASVPPAGNSSVPPAPPRASAAPPPLPPKPKSTVPPKPEAAAPPPFNGKNISNKKKPSPKPPKLPSSVPPASPLPKQGNTFSTEWIPEFDYTSELLVLEPDETDDLNEVSAADKEHNRVAFLSRFSPIKNSAAIFLKKVAPFFTSLKAKIGRLLVDLLKKITIWAGISIEFLKKPLFKNDLPPFILQVINKVKLSRKTADHLQKATRLHLLGVVLGLILLLFLITVIGGSDEKTKTEAAAAAATDGDNSGSNSTSDTKESDDNLHKSDQLNKNAAKTATGLNSVNVTGKEESTIKCHSFGAYPGFLWSDLIHNLLIQLGKSAICDLFGEKSSDIKDAFAGSTIFFNTGFDGLKNATSLEVYPLAALDRDAQKIIFVFINDKLVKIILDFKSNKDASFNKKELDEILEVESHTVRDIMGFKDTSIIDKDLIIHFKEGRLMGKTLKKLIFADKTMMESFKSEFTAYKNAKEALFTADTLFRAKRFKDADMAYRKAAALYDYFGAPYIGRARCALKREDFESAATFAKSAIEKSTDRVIHAKGHKIIAIFKLLKHDRQGALQHLVKAASADPATVYLSTLVKELKTGHYSTYRVALTAARMTCLNRIGASPEGVLARGNFVDSDSFFEALKIAKRDVKFNSFQKQHIRVECR